MAVGFALLSSGHKCQYHSPPTLCVHPGIHPCSPWSVSHTAYIRVFYEGIRCQFSFSAAILCFSCERINEYAALNYE